MVDFKYSYSTCNSLINFLCMDDDKVNISDLEIEPNTLILLMLRMYSEIECIRNDTISKDKIDSLLITSLPIFLEMLFKEKVRFDFNNMQIIVGDGNNEKYITKENYDKFRIILKERNCLADLDGIDEYENPGSEMARKLMEKSKKLKEKIKKAKARSGEDDEDGLSMADLISIFAESEKMPLQDIYDKYDIYQFNNQFNRLKIMEDYQVNIQALLAGAKSENIKLQHWLSKIKKQDD